MSNSFNKPTIETRESAVATDVPVAATADTVVGTERETTPATIYKNAITDFKDFLNGSKSSGDLAERKRIQKVFIKNLWKALELEDNQVKEILDHFLITIAENKDTFSDDKIIAPLYALEGDMAASELTRYKRFMVFITTLSEYARNRTQFLSRFDMTRFEAMFSPAAKVRLHNYVYR